jgi:hypothetical protein
LGKQYCLTKWLVWCIAYWNIHGKTTCAISLSWNKPDHSIYQDKSLNTVTAGNSQLPVTRYKGFLMVNNHEFNNACRTVNNIIPKDLDQFNKTPLLNKQNTNTLTIFHHHMCGLYNNKEELLKSLTINSPQIICITENHLIEEQFNSIPLHPYTLGDKFCTQTHKWEDLCIFVQDNMHCININMDR